MLDHHGTRAISATLLATRRLLSRNWFPANVVRPQLGNTGRSLTAADTERSWPRDMITENAQPELGKAHLFSGKVRRSNRLQQNGA
jgi:hypothetical protein